MKYSERDLQDLTSAFRYGIQYLQQIEEKSVFPSKSDLRRLADFEEELPANGIPTSHIIDKLFLNGARNTTAMAGGRYFGFVNGGSLPGGLAARILADFWDQNAALQVMSPVLSKLENTVEKWLVKLFGLPSESAVGFVSGTSVSIICGLAAARQKVFKDLNWNINQQGFYGAPKIRIVTGRHAHASVTRAIATLGFGLDQIEWVACDLQGRIIAEEIPGLGPNSILILQAGNVNSGSFDPFHKICQRAKDEGAWIHIDGAFGLWAAGSPHLRHLVQGMPLADSWSCDAHKTLNTPYDNGLIICRDGTALRTALQSNASYITYSEDRDGMLYTPEMSRRGRIVELWATLKYLGKDGLADLVDQLHVRALQFANELANQGFQILNDVVFNQVLVAGENDTETQKILDGIQQSGTCWCGGSLWQGQKVIRISICSWATSKEDVSRSVKVFCDARAATTKS